MGLFNLFNRKQSESEPSENEFTVHLVDRSYLLALPADWQPYKSDRFRAANQSKTVDFSATNMAKSIEKPEEFNVEDLKAQMFPTMKRFVTEGGYIAIGEPEIGEDFIQQAFTVDDETQYCHYTYKVIHKLHVIVMLILKEKGGHNSSTYELLKKIAASIAVKVG